MRYLGEVLTCPSGHAAEAEGFANDLEAPPPDLVDVTVPLNHRRPVPFQCPMEPMLQPGDRYPIDAVGFCNSRLALTGRLTRGSDQVKRSGSW